VFFACFSWENRWLKTDSTDVVLHLGPNAWWQEAEDAGRSSIVSGPREREPENRGARRLK